MIQKVINFIVLHAFAAEEPAKPAAISVDGINFAQGSGLSGFTKGISGIINLLYVIAGTSAIIYFIYSGILYITAAGNPDAAKKGQQGLINATIGIIVVALSYFLVTFIADWAVKFFPTP
jgi:hypothetical protein